MLLHVGSYGGLRSGVEQPSSMDTFVFEYYPNNSYGTYEYMDAGNDPAGYERWSLITFDISGLPAVLTKAELWLYAGAGSSSSLLCASRITSSWDNNTTWNTRPGITGVYDNHRAYRDQWNKWDVLDIVQYGKDNPSEWYGICIRMSPLTEVSVLSFATRENSNANLRPKLVWEGIG